MLRYICRTCPYTCSIVRDQVFPLQLKRKQVDDVLGGQEAWENVDKTQGAHQSSAMLLLPIPCLAILSLCPFSFSLQRRARSVVLRRPSSCRSRLVPQMRSVHLAIFKAHSLHFQCLQSHIDKISFLGLVTSLLSLTNQHIFPSLVCSR